MKVDLLALRKVIEQEIVKLEEEGSRLQQQLQHITAVEKIAEASRSRLHIVEQSGPPVVNEDAAPEPSRRWFQKV